MKQFETGQEVVVLKRVDDFPVGTVATVLRTLGPRGDNRRYAIVQLPPAPKRRTGRQITLRSEDEGKIWRFL